MVQPVPGRCALAWRGDRDGGAESICGAPVREPRRVRPGDGAASRFPEWPTTSP